MTRQRYTGKDLERDVKTLNDGLAKAGHDLRFDVGYRYGYTAIDLATVEQLERHCCQRMLTGGSPRECLAECNRYVAAVLMEKQLQSA